MRQAVQISPVGEEQILDKLCEVAGDLEMLVANAIQALLSGKTAAQAGITQRLQQINNVHGAIDRTCRDLTLKSARLRVSGERARNLSSLNALLQSIGYAASRLAAIESADEHWQTSLQPLGIATAHVCCQVLRALQHRDLVLMASVVSSQSTVDRYRNYARGNLASAEPASESAMLRANRLLEFLAEKAGEVAEQAERVLGRDNSSSERVSLLQRDLGRRMLP